MGCLARDRGRIRGRGRGRARARAVRVRCGSLGLLGLLGLDMPCSRPDPEAEGEMRVR